MVVSWSRWKLGTKELAAHRAVDACGDGQGTDHVLKRLRNLPPGMLLNLQQALDSLRAGLLNPAKIVYGWSWPVLWPATAPSTGVPRWTTDVCAGQACLGHVGYVSQMVECVDRQRLDSHLLFRSRYLLSKYRLTGPLHYSQVFLHRQDQSRMTCREHLMKPCCPDGHYRRHAFQDRHVNHYRRVHLLMTIGLCWGARIFSKHLDLEASYLATSLLCRLTRSSLYTPLFRCRK